MSEIKWTAFGDLEPLIAEKILVAWIKCGEVEEAIGPFTYVCRTHFDSRFTHWCPASVLPPVPAKRDYCREAWEKLEPWCGLDEGNSRPYLRGLDLSCAKIAVSIELYRIIWNAAIACAKENGLEKV